MKKINSDGGMILIKDCAMDEESLLKDHKLIPVNLFDLIPNIPGDIRAIFDTYLSVEGKFLLTDYLTKFAQKKYCFKLEHLKTSRRVWVKFLMKLDGHKKPFFIWLDLRDNTFYNEWHFNIMVACTEDHNRACWSNHSRNCYLVCEEEGLVRIKGIFSELREEQNRQS